MKKTEKNIALAIAVKNLADKAAASACGSASWWGLHQIKEPKVNKKA